MRVFCTSECVSCVTPLSHVRHKVHLEAAET